MQRADLNGLRVCCLRTRTFWKGPMSVAETRALIERYYFAFNEGDVHAMLDCLAPTVAHDVNQGPRRRGKKKFGEFLEHMNRCYRERLSDIAIMVSPDGSRAAAEFQLKGKYLTTDKGLPKAAGQTYRLSVAATFTVRDGRITRIATHYNLADWLAQVRGKSA